MQHSIASAFVGWGEDADTQGNFPVLLLTRTLIAASSYRSQVKKASFNTYKVSPRSQKLQFYLDASDKHIFDISWVPLGWFRRGKLGGPEQQIHQHYRISRPSESWLLRTQASWVLGHVAPLIYNQASWSLRNDVQLLSSFYRSFVTRQSHIAQDY